MNPHKITMKIKQEKNQKPFTSHIHMLDLKLPWRTLIFISKLTNMFGRLLSAKIVWNYEINLFVESLFIKLHQTVV